MRKLTSFVMFLCVLSACRRAEMQTYRVAKEADSLGVPGENGSMGGGALPQPFSPQGEGVLPEGHPPLSGDLPPGHPPLGAGDMTMENAAARGFVPSPAPSGEVTWVVPAGWREKPGSGFRYASFVVPGSGTLTGDLSVTVLEGEAGGLLSNVNRWRGQIGLPELTETQLPSATKTIRPAGRVMTFVSCASPSNLIDGKYKRRLSAAVCSSRGKTWFFKLVGEDGLVQSAEKDFLRFLESVKGL